MCVSYRYIERSQRKLVDVAIIILLLRRVIRCTQEFVNQPMNCTAEHIMQTFLVTDRSGER